MASKNKKNIASASELTATKKSNKVVFSTMVIFTIVFLFMAGYYAYFIYFESNKLANNEYNPRYTAFSQTIVRGKILSDSGEVLAYTKTNDEGKEIRVYPFGDLFAHVVGLYDYGQTGVELSCNYELLNATVNSTDEIKSEFSGVKLQGDNVVTTLNRSLQQAAYDALGDNDGAVVCVDPKTGKILCLVSKPTYDPNELGDYIQDLIADDSGSSVLLNRATQGLYTPGSTFKIFTALQYLKEHNGDDSDFKYYCPGTLPLNNYNIRCYGGRAHWNENLEQSFAYSCNGAFATIGLELDVDKFRTTLNERMLFDTQLPIDLKTSKSSFVLTADDTEFEKAQTAMGQGRTLVTPMHMALIASAIANDGMLVNPYIVDHIENSYGDVVKKNESNSYGRLMSKEHANKIKEYMNAVVDYGTAKILNNKKYNAYGKTGTAQISKYTDRVNSWFVGSAEVDNKTLSICVVIENVDEGSASATEVAGKVFDKYFK